MDCPDVFSTNLLDIAHVVVLPVMAAVLAGRDDCAFDMYAFAAPLPVDVAGHVFDFEFFA